MDIDNSLINHIKTIYPKLFITELLDNDIKFKPEDDMGFVEYKRTLSGCSITKTEKYATQMKWRISENPKRQFAIYYIGVGDDGRIIGLDENEAIDCISQFMAIAGSIKASISNVQIIHTNNKIIIRFHVKIKKNENYIYDLSISDE